MSALNGFRKLGIRHGFDRAAAEPIDFGIGYRWRAQSSNLMLAARTNAAMPEALASAESGSVVGKVQDKNIVKNKSGFIASATRIPRRPALSS